MQKNFYLYLKIFTHQLLSILYIKKTYISLLQEQSGELAKYQKVLTVLILLKTQTGLFFQILIKTG